MLHRQRPNNASTYGTASWVQTTTSPIGKKALGLPPHPKAPTSPCPVDRSVPLPISGDARSTTRWKPRPEAGSLRVQHGGVGSPMTEPGLQARKWRPCVMCLISIPARSEGDERGRVYYGGPTKGMGAARRSVVRRRPKSASTVGALCYTPLMAGARHCRLGHGDGKHVLKRILMMLAGFFVCWWL